MTEEYSEEVRYLPWVGERYREPKRSRWLILGESSYYLKPSEQYAVQEMIRAQYGAANDPSQNGTYRFFAGAQRLMTGRDDLNPADTKDFWQNVAFYNYVRDSMHGPTQRPTRQQFKESLPAFNEVVTRLKPHAVLILGLNLWMALPGERQGWQKGRELDISMPDRRSRARRLRVWTGHVKWLSVSHRFACFPVMHPSSIGFAVSKWRDWMSAAKHAVAAAEMLESRP